MSKRTINFSFERLELEVYNVWQFWLTTDALNLCDNN